MKWSWTLARVAGIDVRIHATFLLLLIWVGASSWFGEGTLVGAAAGIGFAVLLFGIVVLHELGHALAARHYGIRTLDITLLPIGGVARLEKIPEDPRAELVVALAGPAVNVALAAALAVVAVLAGAPLGSFATSTDPELPLLARLFWINVALAGFNLVPAFPTDGGRVLRALLALRLDHHRATRIAAAIGQAFALLLGFAGLFGSPLLVFVALFVWLGAAAELAGEELHVAIQGLRVGDAMVRSFAVLAPMDTLAAAAHQVVAGFQTCFPVVADGRVVGMLTHEALIVGLAQHGAELLVARAMDPHPTLAVVDEPLEAALGRMRQAEKAAAVVCEGEAPIGLLTDTGIAELVALHGALARRHPRRAPA